MNKDKFLNLTKYANDTKNKLSDKAIPVKHKNREVQYRQFLQRELSAVNAKLEDMKTLGITDKK